MGGTTSTDIPPSERFLQQYLSAQQREWWRSWREQDLGVLTAKDLPRKEAQSVYKGLIEIEDDPMFVEALANSPVDEALFVLVKTRARSGRKRGLGQVSNGATQHQMELEQRRRLSERLARCSTPVDPITRELFVDLEPSTVVQLQAQEQTGRMQIICYKRSNLEQWFSGAGGGRYLTIRRVDQPHGHRGIDYNFRFYQLPPRAFLLSEAVVRSMDRREATVVKGMLTEPLLVTHWSRRFFPQETRMPILLVMPFDRRLRQRIETLEAPFSGLASTRMTWKERLEYLRIEAVHVVNDEAKEQIPELLEVWQLPLVDWMPDANLRPHYGLLGFQRYDCPEREPLWHPGLNWWVTRKLWTLFCQLRSEFRLATPRRVPTSFLLRITRGRFAHPPRLYDATSFDQPIRWTRPEWYMQQTVRDYETTGLIQTPYTRPRAIEEVKRSTEEKEDVKARDDQTRELLDALRRLEDVHHYEVMGNGVNVLVWDQMVDIERFAERLPQVILDPIVIVYGREPPVSYRWETLVQRWREERLLTNVRPWQMWVLPEPQELRRRHLMIRRVNTVFVKLVTMLRIPLAIRVRECVAEENTCLLEPLEWRFFPAAITTLEQWYQYIVENNGS